MEAARAAADEVGAPLAVVTVGANGTLTAAEAWCEQIGLNEGAAVLVRPDGFVAFRADAAEEPADLGATLGHAFARALGKSRD